MQTALNNKNFTTNKTKTKKITNQYVRLHRDCLNEHGEAMVVTIMIGGLNKNITENSLLLRAETKEAKPTVQGHPQ